MSAAAVCQNMASAAAALHLRQEGCGLMALDPMEEVVKAAEEERFDIWSSIQKEKEQNAPPPQPYVHPLVRRSSSLMSQKSLEICTESLGSETGSDGFSSGDELDGYFSPFSLAGETGEEVEEEDEVETEEAEEKMQRNVLATVNYHCSIGRRSPAKSFPPPLPSISRRDGPCLKMKPHRRNGRLVVEAVKVPSQNYLHAERHGGRLLLSFIETCFRPNSPAVATEQYVNLVKEEDIVEEEDDVVEEEEEEVEVVDRGTVVEVKVSTQPQPVSGAVPVKVHRSSLVINKFVVGEPLPNPEEPLPPNPQAPGTTAASVALTPARSTTAAAAAVAASSISTSTTTTDGFHYNYLHCDHDGRWGLQSPAAAAAVDAKLLFTSRRRSREELLHDMWRCSELRRPLFIFEQPYCIATTS